MVKRSKSKRYGLQNPNFYALSKIEQFYSKKNFLVAVFVI